MPTKQSDILTFYQTQFYDKLHKQSKDWLRSNLLLISNWKSKRLNCNDSSFEALSAFGNLSFGRLCNCISKSEPGCWTSSSNETFDLKNQTNNIANQLAKFLMINWVITYQMASTPFIRLRQSIASTPLIRLRMSNPPLRLLRWTNL